MPVSPETLILAVTEALEKAEYELLGTRRTAEIAVETVLDVQHATQPPNRYGYPATRDPDAF